MLHQLKDVIQVVDFTELTGRTMNTAVMSELETFVYILGVPRRDVVSCIAVFGLRLQLRVQFVPVQGTCEYEREQAIGRRCSVSAQSADCLPNERAIVDAPDGLKCANC